MMGKLAHIGSSQTKSPLRPTEGILESTKDRPTEGPLTQVHRGSFQDRQGALSCRSWSSKTDRAPPPPDQMTGLAGRGHLRTTQRICGRGLLMATAHAAFLQCAQSSRRHGSGLSLSLLRKSTLPGCRPPAGSNSLRPSAVAFKSVVSAHARLLAVDVVARLPWSSKVMEEVKIVCFWWPSSSIRAYSQKLAASSPVSMQAQQHTYCAWWTSGPRIGGVSMLWKRRSAPPAQRC